MARTSRRPGPALLFLLAAAPIVVQAQLTSVPNLTTATELTATSTGSDATTTGTSATSNADSTATSTNTDSSTTDSSASTTGTGTTSSVFHLTGVPTIAGAGIPSIGVPDTANAPYMKPSSLPEGTVFIAVGGVLALFGATILLWRGIVAWSVNRSVKRAALASIRGGGSEKPSSSGYWGGGATAGYRNISQKPIHTHTPYKDLGGSSVSLDHLTSTGKPVKPHFRDTTTSSAADRTTSASHPAPSDLFFSPTANAAGGNPNRESVLSHRNSGYLPSGYYASPNSAPSGGTIGGTAHPSFAPAAQRNSVYNPSPPPSPGLPPMSRGSATLRAPGSRDGYGSNRNSAYVDPRSGRSSGIYAQPSSSSLMVGQSSASELNLSRAPSAYFEDLLENHGNGPRERF